MAKAKRLTKAETKWLEELQALLDACPSKRLGCYTIGDPSVTVFDKNVLRAWDKENPRCELDGPQQVLKCGADLDFVLMFPFAVEGVCG